MALIKPLAIMSRDSLRASGLTPRCYRKMRGSGGFGGTPIGSANPALEHEAGWEKFCDSCGVGLDLYKLLPVVSLRSSDRLLFVNPSG